MAERVDVTVAGLRKQVAELQTRAGQMLGSARSEGVAAVHCERIDLTRQCRSPRRCGAVDAPGVLGKAARRSRSSTRSIPRRRGPVCGCLISTFNEKRCYYAGNVNILTCLEHGEVLSAQRT